MTDDDSEFKALREAQLMAARRNQLSAIAEVELAIYRAIVRHGADPAEVWEAIQLAYETGEWEHDNRMPAEVRPFRQEAE